MRGLSLALRLWPGAALLWRHGAWHGLLLALGFAALVDLALMTTFVWTELVALPVRNAAWLLIAIVWGVSLLASHRWGPPAPLDDPEPLFQQALSEYLKGDWTASERLLARLLDQHPGDIEARLLLATVLRRSDRLDDAQTQLERLSRQDDSYRWAAEIYREQAIVERRRGEREPNLLADVWKNHGADHPSEGKLAA